MRFLIDHVFDFHGCYAELGAGDASPDMVSAILEEGARFCENVLAPLNRGGDEEGCHFDNGVVTTPTGFKQAFARSEEHTSELQSLLRISYAVFCLKKKK